MIDIRPRWRLEEHLMAIWRMHRSASLSFLGSVEEFLIGGVMLREKSLGGQRHSPVC
jgi:hypothetical protein